MKTKIALVLLLVLCTVCFAGCSVVDGDGTERTSADEAMAQSTNTTATESTEKTTEAKTADAMAQVTEATKATEQSTKANATKGATVSERDKAVDYYSIYEPLLNRYYNIISMELSMEDVEDNEIGIVEAANVYETKEAALSSIGYTLRDINGDGVSELLVGYLPDVGSSYGTNLLMGYTCTGETPTLLFTGWYRNTHYVLDDGEIFYSGSGGAAYTMFGFYELPKNSKELDSKAYYFTDFKNGEQGEIGYYLSKTPEGVSKEIEENRFWGVQEETLRRTMKIDLVPFNTLNNGEADTTYEATSEAKELSVVAVGFAKDIVNIEDWDESLPPPYETFVAYEGEGAVKLAFMQVGEIKDFRFYSLEVTDVDDEGNLSFNSKELYKRKTLSEEDPVIIQMCFPGTFPSYGFSYVDEEGTKAYSLNLSGKDGSIVFNEIKL